MAEEGKIGITILKDTWKKLSLIKLNKDIRTFEDLFKYFIEKEESNGNDK